MGWALAAMLAAIVPAAPTPAPTARLPLIVRLSHPAGIDALVDGRFRDHLDALRALRSQRATEAVADAHAPPLAPRGPVYRLPAIGPVVNDGGLQANAGLLIAARAGGAAIAPASGRVAYAGRFRRYGQVLILDHGRGWTSVVTGLAAIDVPQGAALSGGDPIGRAAGRVRLLLLHHGQVVDIAAMIVRVG